MKYILKKDLPLAKAGTEVEVTSNSDGTSKITFHNFFTNQIFSLGEIFDRDIPEWIEEIKEPKTIYDLKEGDEYWFIHKDVCKGKLKTRFGEHAHTLSFLTEREAKRNKLLRELATRTDKWLPNEGEIYYSYHLDGCDNWNWQGDNTDFIKYHTGLVFRNKQEYDRYLTEEAKDLLFNI